MYTNTYIVKTIYTFVEEEKKHIMRVRRNKTTGQKFITIPKDVEIYEDDYVRVKKVVDNNKK